MRFRIIDSDGDWVFGNNPAEGLDALMFDIKTGLLSWKGDCFFALQDGIDWKNLLDYGTEAQLKREIKALVMKKPGVLRVNEIEIKRSDRSVTVSVSVDTIYGRSVRSVVSV